MQPGVGRALRVDEKDLVLDDDTGLVLAHGHDALLDAPALPADRRERLQDLDAL